MQLLHVVAQTSRRSVKVLSTHLTDTSSTLPGEMGRKPAFYGLINPCPCVTMINDKRVGVIRLKKSKTKPELQLS